MKKFVLLFTLSIAALAFTGCEKKEYKLEARPGELTFEAQASAAQTVTVTSENVNWDVEKITDAAWLHLEKQEGSVSVTVDNNPDTQSREAKFKITGDNSHVADVEITVTQRAAEEPPLTYSLEVDKTELNFGAVGASGQVITVTAENVEWDVQVADGISFVQVEKGTDMVTVTVNDNLMPFTRGGGEIITITSSVSSVPGIGISVEQAANADSNIFLSGEASYNQDSYGVGESNFSMSMYTVEFEDDEYRYPIGDGYGIHLSFFSEKPADELNPDIAAGTYVVENTYRKFTVIPGEYNSDWDWFFYSYVTVIEDGMWVRELGVSGGSFTVERDPESQDYVITFSLELSDGTNFTGYYDGELHVDHPFLSNLTGDVDLPELIGGNLIFYGDYNINDGMYTWNPVMWTSGISVEGGGFPSGSGYMIMLELISAPEGDGSLLPTGTYTVDDSREAGTAVPGGIFLGPYACWYLELVDGNFSGAMAPFSSGSLTVSYSDGIYNIVCDVKDDIGYRITSEFEGPMELFDWSDGPSPAPQKISAGKLFNRAGNMKRQDMPKVLKPEIMEHIKEMRNN